MLDIERQIAKRVEAFVAELSDLLRRAALQQAAEILSEQAEGVAPKRGRRARRTVNVRRAKKGSRRSQKQIDGLAKRLLSDIKANPGRRVEEIVKDLGVPTRDVNLPIKKLLASKAISRKGQRRATRYYPKGAKKK